MAPNDSAHVNLVVPSAGIADEGSQNRHLPVSRAVDTNIHLEEGKEDFVTWCLQGGAPAPSKEVKDLVRVRPKKPIASDNQVKANDEVIKKETKSKKNQVKK